MCETEPQRKKKVVSLCAAVACMAAAAVALRSRPMAVGGAIALQAVTLVDTMAEFTKLKGQGK